jgi:transposase-like protein
MATRSYEKLQASLKSLSPEERRSFAEFASDEVRKQPYDIDGFVASSKSGKWVGATDVIKCPHCDQTEVVKFGIRRGKQWYRCKGCMKTFSSVTNTLLDYTKKDFQTWATFVKCMIDGFSLRKTADICEIHRNTAFVWRHKILNALAEYQERQPPLKGVVEADDTFFNLSYKGSKPKGRKAHKRGTPATKRGISKEKVCVSCAVDRKKHVYSKVITLGRPTAEVLQKAFGRKLPKKKYNNNTRSITLCTDKDTAYASFATKNGFKHIRLKNGLASQDTIYHNQYVNGYHSRLKHFLRRFKGVSTKYLNNYLVWNNVIQETRKAKFLLLKLCLRAKKVTRWDDVSRRPAVPKI